MTMHIMPRAAAACLVIVAVAALALDLRPQGAAPRANPGVMASSVMDRSIALCRKIAGPGAELSCTARRVEDGPTGAREAVWLVDCSRDDGAHLMSLVWDARTGELRTMSPGRTVRALAAEPIVQREQAVAASWRALRSAGVGADRWRMAGAGLVDRRWWVRWETPSRTACVSLDRDTGEVIYAYQRPRQRSVAVSWVQPGT